MWMTHQLKLLQVCNEKYLELCPLDHELSAFSFID